MNIIFGREHAAMLETQHTVLELDTLRFGKDGDEVTVFCVVENIPILDMPKIEKMKELHANLMIEYRKQNWNYCEQAMEHLVGFWNHEMDTFYDSILSRVNQYKDESPAEGWDGVIEKSVA